jgi:hypothetical protein
MNLWTRINSAYASFGISFSLAMVHKSHPPFATSEVTCNIMAPYERNPHLRSTASRCYSSRGDQRTKSTSTLGTHNVARSEPTCAVCSKHNIPVTSISYTRIHNQCGGAGCGQSTCKVP